MLKTALVFGSISGAIVISTLILGLALSGGQGAFSSELFGYLVMIIALSMIFFGIKRYRDRELGGVIKFGAAFLMGLAIAAVAGVIYVAVWEVYLAATNYAFMDSYTAAVLEAKRAEGVSGPALETLANEMRTLNEQYANPLFRVPMTFLEIFPVGLIVALISAALLRNAKFLPARA
jgi:hypothetical protein